MWVECNSEIEFWKSCNVPPSVSVNECVYGMRGWGWPNRIYATVTSSTQYKHMQTLVDTSHFDIASTTHLVTTKSMRTRMHARQDHTTVIEQTNNIISICVFQNVQKLKHMQKRKRKKMTKKKLKIKEWMTVSFWWMVGHTFICHILWVIQRRKKKSGTHVCRIGKLFHLGFTVHLAAYYKIVSIKCWYCFHFMANWMRASLRWMSASRRCVCRIKSRFFVLFFFPSSLTGLMLLCLPFGLSPIHFCLFAKM